MVARRQEMQQLRWGLFGRLGPMPAQPTDVQLSLLGNAANRNLKMAPTLDMSGKQGQSTKILSCAQWGTYQIDLFVLTLNVGCSC